MIIVLADLVLLLDGNDADPCVLVQNVIQILMSQFLFVLWDQAQIISYLEAEIVILGEGQILNDTIFNAASDH